MVVRLPKTITCLICVFICMLKQPQHSLFAAYLLVIVNSSNNALKSKLFEIAQYISTLR